jgi:hypothetical protein
MSHAEKADRLLIKPAAGARPAPPCRTDGSFARHARRPVTRRVTSSTETPGWRRPQTDRPAESHSPLKPSERALWSVREAEHPYVLRLREVEAWVAGHVDLTGPLELVHKRPWGSVWRAPAPGGLAWVKVCAPAQAFEPRLTAALASRWPGLLPEVLAHDGQRGWLLLADGGKRLGFGVGPEPWLSLLPAYAELQRGEAAHVAEHLDGGVPDRRLTSFPSLYQEMLAHDLPLSTADSVRLRAFGPGFTRLCEELEAAGTPATMQHDDLHGNNIYPYNDGTRILDWGDSCVSHPFLTLFVTYLHLETMEGLPRGDHSFGRVRDAYLEPWGRPSELRETFELAQRLGPFAHVFKELRVLDAIPERERHFVRDLPDTLARCIAIVP